MNNNHITFEIIESPVGELVIGATEAGSCVCEFHDRGGFERIRARVERRHAMEMSSGTLPILGQLKRELGEYFAGARKEFSVKLDLKGTTFERDVWKELLAIPYGETRAYGEIAAMLGKPGAARAVGRANGSNYLAIIVPCHRVIQEDGALRGYGGGLWRKKFLLDLERSSLSGPEVPAIGQTQLAFSV